jgi:hypothetical protein
MMPHHALSKAQISDSLAQEFASLDAYLMAIHEIVQEGHMPDVADLDDRVAHLCSNVEIAPQEIQESCLAKLDTLLEKLDACEGEMTAFYASAPK